MVLLRALTKLSVVGVVFLTVVLLFSPLAHAEDVDALPGSVASPALDEESESAPLPDGGADYPGGPSPSPGDVHSSYTPQDPVVSAVPGDAEPPRLTITEQGFRYDTVAGEYNFPVSKPFLLRYRNPDGDELAFASTFVAMAPGVVSFNAPVVVNYTDVRFEVAYSLLRNGEQVGTVTITYDFKDDSSPKISAHLESPDAKRISLAWVVLTRDTVAREIRAINDIQGVLGITVRYVPYYV